MSKNIIICCDGMGNQFSSSNTNIAEIYRLAANNTKEQIAYYDPCVGKWGGNAGYALGYGLQTNIEDAYRYLMNNYLYGDKIFMFGFSRGAFTVRCLAGMIHKCGLLFKGNNNLVPYVSKIYNSSDNDTLTQDFKTTSAQEIPIHFIGVFDTVASLGWIYDYKNFFDDTIHTNVRYGYHALAIDEKRNKFYPSLWDESEKADSQTIEIKQVWFAGVHSDIGGNYPEDGLAKITLKWMLEKAIACELLLANEDEHAKIPYEPAAPMHESFTWNWKPFGKKIRAIPENAIIHKSVFERKDNPKCNYNPSNIPPIYSIEN